MDSQYQTIFRSRGHSYDGAMRFQPRARDLEFQRLFDDLDWSNIQQVLDIPSGGGYLQQHLPPHCELHSVEPCREFGGGSKIDRSDALDLKHIQLESQRYDLIVSLAALHHVENKARFINILAKALSPAGVLCIADVAEDSGVAAFLDDFAGAHNQTGHEGSYLSARQMPDYLSENPRLGLLSHQLRECPWHFPDEETMTEFCRRLFGIQGVSNDSLLSALAHYIGFRHEAGEVLLKWQLLYIKLHGLPELSVKQTETEAGAIATS